ncbi:MAG: c-type cytochrome [Acidobacteriota bacterium]|nr:c-type cytochrome [Acidobacteriota bacterium]
MKQIRLLVPLLIIAIIAAIKLSAESAQATVSAPEEKRAEQVYKNIQVLKGLPVSQFDSVMAFISGSLGVKCNYCHVNPFEKDDKPAKVTARKMIQMVFDLNKGSFNGQGGAITCYTCHRGQPLPVSVPAVGQNLWQPSNAAAKKEEAPLPTVDQILDRYAEAAGGRAAIGRVTSFVLKGSRVGADGVLVPEEVYAKAPDKLLVVTSYPNMVFRSGFDGAEGWAQSSRGRADLNADQLAQLKWDAEFYRPLKLKDMYSKIAVKGQTTIGDREAYAIEATTPSGSSEKLYFDAQTGLLVRRYFESKTALGQLPLQIDYEDYRDVGGFKLPFMVRWSIPGRIWGRKITEARQNVPLDDAQFSPTAK